MIKEELYLEIVETLFNKCCPEDLCDNVDCSNDEYIKSFVDERIPMGWYSDMGATKIVLINDDEQYVIKIPLLGEENYNEEEDCSEIEEFCCAPYSEEKWNYCESEAIISSYAQQAHLGMCFVPTIRIGTVHNMPIYIQKKVKVFNDCEREVKPKSNSISNYDKLSDYKGCHILRGNFGGLLLEYYGAKFLIKLFKFFVRYDINDLHNSNVGFEDGRPVIFDYAGFNENK